MRNFLLILLVSLITSSQVFAYAVKVYDQWGNRVGTYRKEGDRFVLYDFYENKIENPEELIQNAPSQKTLKDYSQYFFDENMNPIGTYSTGLWHNTTRYYNRGRFIPRCFYSFGSPSIVRPSANTTNILNSPNTPPPGSINIIRTGF